MKGGGIGIGFLFLLLIMLIVFIVTIWGFSVLGGGTLADFVGVKVLSIFR
jgi:hypothetical protein